MKKIFAVAVAGALALPTAAFASIFSCNGCTPQQMYDVAWSELYSPGVQPGYIVNLANGTVAKYANIANIPDPYDPEPPPYEPNIIAVPVEPEIATLIYDLSVLTNGNTRVVDAPAAQQALVSKSSAQTTSGDRLPVNAYENVMDPYLEARVAEMVRMHAQDIEARIAFFAAQNYRFTHFNENGVPVQVTFRFRDGSTSIYFFDLNVNRWRRLKDASRDARDNPIPEQKEQLYNNTFFDFGVDTGPAVDIDWFRWLAESFGVPVIDMRGGLGGGGIVCVDGACYIQNR